VGGAEEDAGSIVFFDGVCGLCNRWVDLLLKTDHRRVLQFAPLQGETAAAELRLADSNYKSVLFKHRGRIYDRSDAVLQILMAIGGVWSLAGVFRIIPRPIRNALYDYVARHRYRWFGQSETCRVPAPEEFRRLLP
jgi:predicted DCC family thiol-disulfide oxidoreductase YuxK